MELFWNAGRLTDLGALAFAVVVTVSIFRVVLAKAYRTEPERLVWPPMARVSPEPRRHGPVTTEPEPTHRRG